MTHRLGSVTIPVARGDSVQGCWIRRARLATGRPLASALATLPFPNPMCWPYVPSGQCLDFSYSSMRILIVNQSAKAPDRGGSTRQFTFAKSLVRRGDQVTIVASSLDHFTHQNYKATSRGVPQTGTHEGVDFVWLHESPHSTSMLGRLKGMTEFMTQVRSGAWMSPSERPDVVVGSSPNLIAAWGGYALAKKLNCPFVFEVRDIWPQTIIDLAGLSPWHPGILLLGHIEKTLYRKSDQIVALMPLAKEHIVSRGGAGDKVTWIPNGVDLEMVPPDPGRQRADGQAFRVTYAGAHGRANALDSIVEAAKLLQMQHGEGIFEFVFIGDGTEKQRLERESLEAGLSSVVFLPGVPKREVFSWLYQSDALVVNMEESKLYRFGTSLNKMYDYLAASRPIVFGAETVMNPVDESGAGITVPPSDPHAIAEAIEKLASMTQEDLDVMGQRGEQYARSYHDYARLSDVFAQVIDRAVSAQG